MEPPFKPQVTSETDTRYFDETVHRRKSWLDPTEAHAGNNIGKRRSERRTNALFSVVFISWTEFGSVCGPGHILESHVLIWNAARAIPECCVCLCFTPARVPPPGKHKNCTYTQSVPGCHNLRSCLWIHTRGLRAARCYVNSHPVNMPEWIPKRKEAGKIAHFVPGKLPGFVSVLNQFWHEVACLMGILLVP